ncbi:MAG TPA: Gldg family protein [Dokdonella sp.]|uniref:GldG family protein n=2 Tax=Dokdonella sp. TaxID=2291710 RepID=UPI002B9C10B7|nr:Gldg family protein [Dokdonella sp.]HOX71245.1 Gldg family protein [Dokdonella sp.]HPG93662.1 Gldg family protein [Dokdonella sp.]HPN79029.1 Gldg family protein [Dokdonella sp.]
MTSHRKTLSGGALIVLIILFVALMLVVNVLFRGARVDLTENNLYTLSPGSKEILSKLEEPVNLYLFYSDKGTQNLPQLRTYATRVRELLEEMAARSRGQIKLEVIDPLPFSEDEDRATAYGLQAVPVSNAGETIFLGLAGTNSTNGQSVIPFFQPDKESFLEYDIAKLIHELATPKKPVIGLVSNLPIGAGFDPATRQMRDPWAIQQQLSQSFDVRELNPGGIKSIDADIKVLVLVHPKNLSDEAQYAIDQFVLRGGHLLVFVDPNAELDTSGADPENPQAAMFADHSSDLPKLFKAWGIEYDPKSVVLDRALAVAVSMGQGGRSVRHPGIIGLTAAELSRDDVVTANLDGVNVSSAGYFGLGKDSTSKLVPLMQSSGDAMAAASDRLKMLPDPSALLADFKPSGTRYVIAGRVEGKFKTAFPERSEAGHLAESKDDGQIVIVADTDVLADRLWVQVQDFLGQKLMNAFANNGDLVLNTIDNLTGSSALISIRGRATSQRPFTTVDALKRSADDRFRAKEQELQGELQETERKLAELQSAKTHDQQMILSPEQKSELDNFVKRKTGIRKELRDVRRSLDAEIETLGSRLKFLNIVLVPLLVTLVAAGFAMWQVRRRKSS